MHSKKFRIIEYSFFFFLIFHAVFFPEVGGLTLDSHHGFVVEYGVDRDVDLGRCLHEPFLLFPLFTANNNFVLPITCGQSFITCKWMETKRNYKDWILSLVLFLIFFSKTFHRFILFFHSLNFLTLALGCLYGCWYHLFSGFRTSSCTFKFAFLFPDEKHNFAFFFLSVLLISFVLKL